MTTQRQRYYARNNLRGLTDDPLHGPCTQDCADYAAQQLRPILQASGCLPYGHPPMMGRLRGLGILDLPPMKAGAAFSLGVEISGWDSRIWDSEATIIEEIRTAVQNTGYVTDLQVYSLAEWSDFNPFIVISGRARYDHGSASHLKDHILSAVGSVYGYNAGSVRFEADTYDPATGQVYTDPAQRRIDVPLGARTSPPTPTTQTTQTPLAPGQCSWSQQSFGDWVACQLGITGAVGGITAGATGALVGVGVLTLLAVVLLKR